MSQQLYSRLFALVESGKITHGEALMLVQGGACLFAIIEGKKSLDEIREITRVGLTVSSRLCHENLGELVYTAAMEVVADLKPAPVQPNVPERN
jgi:hypothetical protein